MAQMMDDAEYEAMMEERTLCGEAGHEYADFEDGDPATPYHRVYRVCWVCGAEDDGDDDP